MTGELGDLYGSFIRMHMTQFSILTCFKYTIALAKCDYNGSTQVWIAFKKKASQQH